MDGNASYLDTCKKLTDEIAHSGIGSSYVLVGPEGYGKGEVISYLRDELQPTGMKFFRGSSYLKTELSKYHLFNEILNDAANEFQNRDVEALMNGYIQLLRENNSGKTVIVAEGLESVSDESRDFFLYLSRLTGKYNFNLIGTYTTNFLYNSSLSERFIQLLETEDLVNTIHLGKMKIEDFRFYLTKNGYNLPDRFINDLFRLVDGNINTLSYTLSYYEDHGIINSEKEVDDVVYRFFPIPQALEIHYERILSDLTEKQTFVAELLSLIEEETTYNRLCRFAGMGESEMLKILSRLEKAGVVNEKGFKYDISNYRVRDFITGRMSNTRKLEIYSILSKSELFVELPLQMRLSILLQKGEYEYIGKILQEQGGSIISKFASLKSLIDFLSEFLDKGGSSEHTISASRTRCQALELLGETDAANACYEEIISEFPREIAPKIDLARLNANRGKYDLALDLVERITPTDGTNDNEIGLLFLAKGSALFKKRDYSDAFEMTSRARSILRSVGDRGNEANALNILGNICIETFKHDEAMKYYNQALEINRELGLLENLAKNLNNIAIVKSYNGDYSEAINIFNELINSSYLMGDLLTRAYSTYNLAEIYYILGNIDEVRSYIPSAIKLVELADRRDLKYRFFRFLSVVYLNEMDVGNALEFSNRAMEAVSSSKDGEYYRIAYAMKELFSELIRGEKSDILPSLFLESMPEDDEFLPVFYSIAAIYFVFRGDFENAEKVTDICIKRAEKMGERYGVLVSLLHKGFVLFYQGKMKDLEELISRSPEPTTGAHKYDFLMKFLSLSLKSEKMSKESFIQEAENLSKDQRPTMDFVNLYKETIVAITVKRNYGISTDMKSIVDKIPNKFKYAFNVFAENTSIL